MKNIAVIGGGPAGMMAAYQASVNGNNVTLYERNEKLGKKLFITGKGRCNLTNACDTEELFGNIVTNPKFLYSAIYSFDNSAVCDFFEERGCRLKTERGNRVFPLSDHSSDIIRTMKSALADANVDVVYNKRVVDIITDDKIVTGLRLSDNSTVKYDAVIMATGGKSYQTTGSDGSSFEIVKKLGHTITKLSPALVPLESKDDWIYPLSGLSLKNVTASLWVDNKEKYKEMGELLFTHFGISGPLTLTASSILAKEKAYDYATIYIDLKPALTKEQFDKRLIREFEAGNTKQIKNVLTNVYPQSMISVILLLANVDANKKTNVISKEERERIVEVTKKLPVNISKTRGFDEAIITHGGIKVKDINPSTMESKLIKGLYFAGEMIDTDAYTGGFNLQIAWSTGYLAGISV